MSELVRERRLITSVPGPKSQQLAAGKSAAVADVCVTLPVFVTRAGGGVLEDVDGN